MSQTNTSLEAHHDPKTDQTKPNTTRLAFPAALLLTVGYGIALALLHRTERVESALMGTFRSRWLREESITPALCRRGRNNPGSVRQQFPCLAVALASLLLVYVWNSYRTVANPTTLDDTGIPKHIFQSFKVPYDHLPPAMLNATKSWRDLNPHYAYRYFDDDAQRQYIYDHGSQALIRAYRAATSGAARCDLWRCLIIYREGGIYSDVDTTLLVPLDQILSSNDQGLSGIGLAGDVHQWFLAYAPGHPLMAKLLRHATKLRVQRRNIVSIAGPRALHAVAADTYGSVWCRVVYWFTASACKSFRFHPGVYWTNTRDGGKQRYSLRVIEGDYLAGNVQFKASD